MKGECGVPSSNSLNPLITFGLAVEPTPPFPTHSAPCLDHTHSPRQVCENIIDAACELKWPRSRLLVQVRCCRYRISLPVGSGYRFTV